MASILSSNLTSDIRFSLQYKVEKQEYDSWKTKLQQQYYKNVEVPGFRKGHVPEHIIQKNINQAALSDTIFRETLDKYGNEAIRIVQEEVEKLGRHALNQTFMIDPTNTGEKEDGFLIDVSVELLPEVDLSTIKNIPIPKQTEKDIEGRPSFEEFLKKEKMSFVSSHTSYVDTDEAAKVGFEIYLNMQGTVDGQTRDGLNGEHVQVVLGSGNFLPDFEKGLDEVKTGDVKSFPVTFPQDYFEPSLGGKTAEFTVTIESVKKPKYSTFAEVMENHHEHDHNHENFQTESEFDAYVRSYYDSETKRILENLKQRTIIREVVNHVPDFTLPVDRIDTETDRIFTVLSEDALKTKSSIVEIFAKTDLPGHDAKVVNDEDVKKQLKDYVTKEFKLSSIWNFIYEKHVENKVTEETLDGAVREISKNPGAYGLSSDLSPEDMRDNVFSLLKKQLSAQWLTSQFEEKEVVA
jgi:trigger factor